MKTFLISMCLLFTGLSTIAAQSGSLDSYFKKYQDDDSFTVVNISSSMFAAISGMDIKNMDPDVKAILDNITGLKILTKESDGAKYYDEATKMIKSNGLEELMTIKEKGDNVKIYGKSDGNNALKEVVMLRGDNSNFILMQILGKLSIEQLTKLSKTLNK